MKWSQICDNEYQRKSTTVFLDTEGIKRCTAERIIVPQKTDEITWSIWIPA